MRTRRVFGRERTMEGVVGDGWEHEVMKWDAGSGFFRPGDT
jgi:hypothetical protein